MLENLAISDPLAINDVIYAEISVGYRTTDELETALESCNLRFARIPREALFTAGKAFLCYRRASGTKTGVLPDFLIGAHAAVEGWPLLTRDAARVKTYFPTVDVIEPG
jgi:hypothetical protein